MDGSSKARVWISASAHNGRDGRALGPRAIMRIDQLRSQESFSAHLLSLLPLNVLYVSLFIRYMHSHMFRYRHTRLKLVFMLSRGHLSGTTRHIECSKSGAGHHVLLSARANGVPMSCFAGCARSWGAVRARWSSAASSSCIVVLAHTGNWKWPGIPRDRTDDRAILQNLP